MLINVYLLKNLFRVLNVVQYVKTITKMFAECISSSPYKNFFKRNETYKQIKATYLNTTLI